MTENVIPANAIHAIAALANFTTSNDVTPIIGNVAVSMQNGELVAYATDRYTIAEYRTQLENAPADFDSILIPADFLTKLARSVRRNMFVHMSVGLDSATFNFAGGSMTVTLSTGNFPPVERLLVDEPTNLPESVLLRPTLLARLAKLKDFTKAPKDGEVRFLFQSAGDRDNAPVQISGGPYRVLIQPNLKL